jgi:hypothetical protein
MRIIPLPITTRDRNRDRSDTKTNQIDKNHGEIVVKNPANSETTNIAPPEMNSLLIVYLEVIVFIVVKLVKLVKYLILIHF